MHMGNSVKHHLMALYIENTIEMYPKSSKSLNMYAFVYHMSDINHSNVFFQNAKNPLEEN